MNIEDSHWDEYENRFRAMADKITLHRGALPDMAGADLYLCLYGENGMSPEHELETLTQLEKALIQNPDTVKGIEMLTSYWEDLVLYIP